MMEFILILCLSLLVFFTFSVNANTNSIVNEDTSIYGNTGYYTVRSVHCGDNVGTFKEDDFSNIYTTFNKNIWFWEYDVFYNNNSSNSSSILWVDCGYNNLISYDIAINDSGYGIFDYQGKIGFYFPETIYLTENSDINYFLNVIANYDLTYIVS